MGKLIWYGTGCVLVGLIAWTIFISLRGDFDGHDVIYQGGGKNQNLIKVF